MRTGTAFAYLSGIILVLILILILPHESAHAQFQLPPLSSETGKDRQLPQFLQYQYAFGSESDVNYRRDSDLNRRVRDNELILAPQLSGYITYRLADWLETTLEMILEKEIATQEEPVVILPGGESQFARNRRVSLLVDQAFVRIKGVTDPFEITIGRRNFEDERRWLYDTSLDSLAVKYRKGLFNAEASVSRKDWLDLDVTAPVTKERINNYMLVLEYRGIENTKLSGYAITRHDSLTNEGRPRFYGLRAFGSPSTQLSYWSELAIVRGRDEQRQSLHGHALDIGATYRYTRHSLVPALTLGYAMASGDSDPDDSVNHAFRQTGLQSNENKFGGLSKFKTYGQALDPELSNLGILTIGVGCRPAANMSFDLIYHRYRLTRIADTLRNTALTAEVNQTQAYASRDLGSGVDVVLGFRNLFGVRRLGVDLRAGWFFPGAAFIRNDGSDSQPVFSKSNKGIAILAKFWW